MITLKDYNELVVRLFERSIIKKRSDSYLYKGVPYYLSFCFDDKYLLDFDIISYSGPSIADIYVSIFVVTYSIDELGMSVGDAVSINNLLDVADSKTANEIIFNLDLFR